jgi:hypothetical protein
VQQDQEVAGEAIGLLETAGLHGHRYATHAALAAVALRQRGDVSIFTSDEEDMRLLCGDRVVVHGVRDMGRSGELIDRSGSTANDHASPAVSTAIAASRERSRAVGSRCM